MTFACAITAGGKATRMSGKTKAFTIINNERIIDSNLKILKKYFDKIIIISNNPEAFSEFSQISIFSDIYKNIGPLAGLHSAIKNTNSDFIFLISSDLPFISGYIIRKLINSTDKHSDCIIPRIGGNIEPLFGIYSAKLIGKLENHIENMKNRSMKSFIETLRAKYIDLDNNKENKLAFTNINSEDDLKALY